MLPRLQRPGLYSQRRFRHLYSLESKGPSVPRQCGRQVRSCCLLECCQIFSQGLIRVHRFLIACHWDLILPLPWWSPALTSRCTLLQSCLCPEGSWSANQQTVQNLKPQHLQKEGKTLYPNCCLNDLACDGLSQILQELTPSFYLFFRSW